MSHPYALHGAKSAARLSNSFGPRTCLFLLIHPVLLHTPNTTCLGAMKDLPNPPALAFLGKSHVSCLGTKGAQRRVKWDAQLGRVLSRRSL